MPACGDAVDVAFVLGGVVVGEIVARGGWQMQRASEEARHLLPAHRAVRAEQVRRAADGDPLVECPRDVIREDRAAVVVDAGASAGLDRYRTARCAEPHARPRALVRLVGLGEEAVRVDGGANRVGAGRHVGDVDPLPREVVLVLVAPPDADPHPVAQDVRVGAAHRAAVEGAVVAGQRGGPRIGVEEAESDLRAAERAAAAPHVVAHHLVDMPVVVPVAGVRRDRVRRDLPRHRRVPRRARRRAPGSCASARMCSRGCRGARSDRPRRSPSSP